MFAVTVNVILTSDVAILTTTFWLVKINLAEGPTDDDTQDQSVDKASGKRQK